MNLSVNHACCLFFKDGSTATAAFVAVVCACNGSALCVRNGVCALACACAACVAAFNGSVGISPPDAAVAAVA